MTKKILVPILLLLFLVSFAGCESNAPNTPGPVVQNQPNANTPKVPVEPAPKAVGKISPDKSFYLVIDGSGSMKDKPSTGNFGSKIEGAKWAVKKFVNDVVPADVNLGLYVFDGRGEGERVKLGKNNREKILGEIDQIRADNGTPLNEAIMKATDALVALGYGESYIVVVTDGEATDYNGSQDKGAKYALANDIEIITIGFGMTSKHGLAKSSRSYRNAANPQELLESLKETQGEMVDYSKN